MGKPGTPVYKPALFHLTLHADCVRVHMRVCLFCVLYVCLRMNLVFFPLFSILMVLVTACYFLVCWSAVCLCLFCCLFVLFAVWCVCVIVLMNCVSPAAVLALGATAVFQQANVHCVVLWGLSFLKFLILGLVKWVFAGFTCFLCEMLIFHATISVSCAPCSLLEESRALGSSGKACRLILATFPDTFVTGGLPVSYHPVPRELGIL